MLIKEMASECRPRERYLRHGVSVLSDAELLALILRNGTKGENVVDMCQRVLSLSAGRRLAAFSLKELQEIKGIGEAKAMQIVALFEFANRQSSFLVSSPIRSAKEVYSYVRSKLAGSDREKFMVLHLNTKNRVIREEIVSLGTLNSSLIHPREVFKTAVKESAHAVIFVHNHPSGDPTPSAEDHQVTRQLKDAGELLDIPVLDHVIVGVNGYYSFKEEGQ